MTAESPQSHNQGTDSAKPKASPAEAEVLTKEPVESTTPSRSVQEIHLESEWNLFLDDDLLPPSDGKSVEQEEAAPTWLIPQLGKFASEKVIFNTLVVDPPPPLPSSKPIENVALDALEILAQSIEFKEATHGMQLTFQQSWYPYDVTLGQLLHSITLAPGESVRVAMIDWSHNVSASNTESLSELEKLDNSVLHARSISEVTKGLAKEAQQGFSQFTTKSADSSRGSSSGASIIIAGEGNSNSQSFSTSGSQGFTSSNGQRDFSASMQQNIMDRSQQHASDVRKKRAMIIKEVNQHEKKSATTRVVTNYNHMHALTIQYYEMLQAYRVELQLVSAEYCLFIPFKLLNFRTNPELIKSFRYYLSIFAVDSDVAKKLLDNDPNSFEKDEAIIEHLSKNSYHYNMAILKNLDISQIIKLLSPFQYNSVPLLQAVSPNPLAILNNYLVFSLGSLSANSSPVTDIHANQKAWLDKHGFNFNKKDERYIALPSGGIHAEAVLGQSNCAEKLDITRFWKWEESPIPILPSDIEALSLSSRAQPVEAKLAQPQDSVLKIVSPNSLPEPSGMSSGLQAIAQGDTFRNMSAAEDAAKLAQTGIQQAAESSKNSAIQASKNMKLAVDSMKGFVKEIAPKIGESIGGLSSISSEGASLNLAKELDKGAPGQKLQRTFELSLGGNRNLMRSLLENSLLKPPAQDPVLKPSSEALIPPPAPKGLSFDQSNS